MMTPPIQLEILLHLHTLISKMKNQIPHLFLAVDLGASGTKVVGSVSGRPECKALLMKPHCVIVSNQELLPLNPNFDEHSTWIEFGEKHYAVGNLAEIRFDATNQLKPAKFATAVPKICAAIGIIAQKFSLPDKFNLSLSFVLPPAEWEHRNITIERLNAAIKDLDTPRGKIKVKLLQVNPYPEGMGILLGQNLELEKNGIITVVMLGFRNTSILSSNNGIVNRPHMSDLGFYELLKNIAGKTGYKIEEMIEPVFEYKGDKKSLELYTGWLVDSQRKLATSATYYSERSSIEADIKEYKERIKELKLSIEKILSGLLRCSGVDREVELKCLIKSIDLATDEYWLKLSVWLEEMMPSQSYTICLSGGTANYFTEELKKFMYDKLSDKNERCVRFHSVVKPPNSLNVYDDRFNDIYSLWHRMSQQPLTVSK